MHPRPADGVTVVETIGGVGPLDLDGAFLVTSRRSLRSGGSSGQIPENRTLRSSLVGG